MLFVSSHSWTHWYHLGLSLNDLKLRTITETMLSQFLLRYEMSTSCLKDQLIPKSPVPSTKGTIVPIATMIISKVTVIRGDGFRNGSDIGETEQVCFNLLI